jgi:dinuclear metal center YbgI/SA1388 family protein
MAINRQSLIRHIEKIAPPHLAEEWDNTGLQINVGSEDIKRVLIALDVTGELIREAEFLNADFIVSHHPLLFHKINSIDEDSVPGRCAAQLIRAGISVYSAHTSFDTVYGGNNDYLAELLGLRRIRRFQPGKEDAGKEPAYGRIGDLQTEMSLAEACLLLKERLNIQHELPVAGDPQRRVLKVGLCTGGGGSMIEAALRNGCSLFITGDVRHDEALLALESGLCLIDAGHFGTEWIFVKNFAEKLRTAVGDVVEIIESRCGRDPVGSI